MRIQAGRPIACVAAEAIPGSTGQPNGAGKPILARFPGHMIHLDVKKVGRWSAWCFSDWGTFSSRESI